VIDEIAEGLSDALYTTVYYGTMPDDTDGTYDECVAIFDYPAGRPMHDFGNDLPAITYYGIEARARSATQDGARAACIGLYEGLLSLGFLSLSPPVTLGQDESGRFIVSAQVRAHEVRV
jgi:hypothetical protein